MKPSASSADPRLGAKPPSSPTLVLWPASCRPLLQGGENFRAHAHRVGHRRRGDRQDHEFLDVDRVVGVLAAVDDVHHRHRQGAGEDAADIAVQRQAANPPRPPWRRPATRPGWRWRRGGPCWRCRRGRSAASSMAIWSVGVQAADASKISPSTLATACCTPLPPKRAYRRRAVRPPRARRWRRRRARRRGRWRRLPAVTSTSTVGLPRLSRISRAMISAMALIRVGPVCCRRRVG